MGVPAGDYEVSIFNSGYLALGGERRKTVDCSRASSTPVSSVKSRLGTITVDVTGSGTATLGLPSTLLGNSMGEESAVCVTNAGAGLHMSMPVKRQANATADGCDALVMQLAPTPMTTQSASPRYITADGLITGPKGVECHGEMQLYKTTGGKYSPLGLPITCDGEGGCTLYLGVTDPNSAWFDCYLVTTNATPPGKRPYHTLSGCGTP